MEGGRGEGRKGRERGGKKTMKENEKKGILEFV